ncbi:hypothetical protein QJS83_04580 [Bdellovibrio sp. 22V]|uniref:hypothetical protein n=1 Tax=Bdellovibrio TaxID=958 RepID=UPI002542E2D6|nr:hypothetical protein [Bdellovibrio sp. 22V]WII73148.1 hypothetical protein QJS83_04580 [Bdellovibrio sp. 22V]
MRIFLLLLPLLVAVHGKAETILIQAPGSSPGRFREYLDSQKSTLPYSAFVLRGLQKNDLQEQRLFQLADSLESDLTNVWINLKNIQTTSPLTITSLRYLRDFTENILKRNLSANEKTEAVHLYCKTASLLNEAPGAFRCPTEVVLSSTLKKAFPSVDVIAIESLAYSVSEDWSFQIAPQTAYQWTLVSNSQKPVQFYGTFEQLLHQHFVFTNLIEGTCEQFSNQELEFELLQRGRIFFDSQCVRNADLTDRKTWIESNKPWLYTAGVVLLGGLVLSLQDKSLVINSP